MRSFALSVALSALVPSVFAAQPAPRPAPALDIVDSSGKEFALSNYRGRVVVVQVLLTDCSHCQAFSQLLVRLQTEYGPKGLQAVGAAVNQATNDMVRDYHAKYASGFPVAAVQANSALAFLGIPRMTRVAFPQIAVIDRSGQIREQSSTDFKAPQPLLDEMYLRGLITRLLAEGRGPAAAKAR